MKDPQTSLPLGFVAGRRKAQVATLRFEDTDAVLRYCRQVGLRIKSLQPSTDLFTNAPTWLLVPASNQGGRVDRCRPVLSGSGVMILEAPETTEKETLNGTH